jgi:hypothetical protein
LIVADDLRAKIYRNILAASRVFSSIVPNLGFTSTATATSSPAPPHG